jgi:hypothetical protein
MSRLPYLHDMLDAEKQGKSAAAFKGPNEVQASQNLVTRLFERFQATIAPAEREDFFHAINRDMYLREFAHYLEAQIDKEHPGND